MTLHDAATSQLQAAKALTEMATSDSWKGHFGSTLKEIKEAKSAATTKENQLKRYLAAAITQ